MNIELIDTKKIKPAAYNPRKDLKPGDPEYAKLQRSIKEFDCVEPLVWNKRTGNLVGGHQRLKILLARGDKQVQCSVVDLPLEKEKALNLALNKIKGDWDDVKLPKLLDELIALPDFDVSLTGFGDSEITKLLDALDLTDGGGEDDDFDVEQELAAIDKPVTKPGELIELGPHRLLCGDCTKPENIKRLLGDNKVQMVFTDPPYAVDYRGGRVGEDWKHKIRQDGEKYWDEMSLQDYSSLLRASLTNAHSFSDDKAVLYLWFASARIAQVLEALETTDWPQRNLIVWNKNTFAGSLFAQYKHRYEPCFYCHKKGQSTRWYGPNNEVTVWDYDKPHKNEGHPTVKPLPLAIRAIRNSSARGDTVLDLFLGSGTTLIAAERLGRLCVGTELEPRYCDLIRKRYERAKTSSTH
ncbi:MAG: DNA modification methylase [Phycisphaerae bacterium]|nr:DNA modification methylase [Phycisphaerae bacterium]